MLDSDAEMLPGALKQLYNVHEKRKSAGIVAPRLFCPAGIIQASYKRFPTIYVKLLKPIAFNHIRRIG